MILALALAPPTPSPIARWVIENASTIGLVMIMIVGIIGMLVLGLILAPFLVAGRKSREQRHYEISNEPFTISHDEFWIKHDERTAAWSKELRKRNRDRK